MKRRYSGAESAQEKKTIKTNAASLLENIRRRKAELQAGTMANQIPALNSIQDPRNRASGPRNTHQMDGGMAISAPDHGNGSATDKNGGQPIPLDTASLLERIRRKKASLRDRESKKVNPYIDPSLPPVRRTRPLAFNEPGKYSRLGASHRRREQIDSIKKDLTKLESKYVDADEPPRQEWWDSLLVGEDGACDGVQLTSHIQHPIEIPPPFEFLSETATQVFLTADEFRRRRKNERFARRKEAQDRVRLGLDPPPPPKVKLSNIASVFGIDYLNDPTKYESRAREAVAERKRIHYEANEGRKLTPSEKWEKHATKIEKNRERALHCAVFRVDGVVDSKHQFLVDAGAKKLLLTGAGINGEQFGLVIVEGGEREVQKFSKLMLRRIGWAVPSSEPTDDSDPDRRKNGCTLLWEGPLRASRFARWSMHRLDEAATENFLKTYGAHDFLLLAKATASSYL